MSIGIGISLALGLLRRGGGAAPEPETPWYLAGGIDAENVVAAYQADGAESQAASYVNLANPGTFDLTTPAAPTWSAETGWQFNGTTQYFNSGVVAGNNWSMVVRFSDFVTTGGYFVGARIANGNNQFTIGRTATTWIYHYGTATGQNGSANTSVGVVGIANTTAWLDGAREAGITLPGTHSSALPIYIGAINNNGSVLTPNNVKIQRVVLYNASVAVQMPLIMALMAEIPLPGAWSWFTTPEAVTYNGKTYFGAVDMVGNVYAYRVTAAGAVQASVLHAALEVNDHDNPSFLVRASDQRIMVWYCKHHGDTIYQRVSTNPQDVSAFDAETSLDAQLGGTGYTYPSPIQLLDETDDPIYLFYRDVHLTTGRALYFSKSTDGGATWPTGTKLFVHTDGHYPYWQICQNGDDRIDIAITNTHPTLGASSLYHFYYTGGNYYQSDGTLIGGAEALPLDPSDVTLVYDGTTTYGWVWDIAIDSNGYPVIAYVNFPGNDGTDHRYRYARWNGTAWTDYEIVAAGSWIKETDDEIFYSGGMALDRADPNVVYLSIQTGSTRVWELYKYTTADGGENWSSEAVTSDSSTKNIRPVVPLNSTADLKVLWLAGTYNHFTSYDTQILSDPQYEVGA